MSGQMTLDLAGAPRLGVEDFMVSTSNEAAFAVIERWPDWPAPWMLMTGPRGSGKTHLAAIWAERACARIVKASEMSVEDAPALAAAALVVEDADAVGRNEAALFHLLNLMRERGGALLLTAASEPSAWDLTTPDLLSRLRLAPQVRLASPDDALMRGVLVKLFVDRQLSVDVGVVEHLALHLDRSLDAARRIVETLDARSLSERRRITRAMAREAVQAAGLDSQRELFAEDRKGETG